MLRGGGGTAPGGRSVGIVGGNSLVTVGAAGLRARTWPRGGGGTGVLCRGGSISVAGLGGSFGGSVCFGSKTGVWGSRAKEPRAAFNSSTL
jgi:hypothetical protein